MKAVLGLDTSCYVTSLALVDVEGQILLNARTPLAVCAGERGLRQSDAVFCHVRQLPELFQAHARLLQKAEIAAVAASIRPRPTEDSYMPVFRVGEGQGRACAHLLGVPFFASNHQDGHIQAALWGTRLSRSDDFLAFHLSGGTTELLRVGPESQELLGGTQDLHAGQLVDRIGQLLGCPFPAGPALERLARQGKATGRLGVSIRSLHCHLSGVETMVRRLVEQGTCSAEDLAAEVYDFLARTVARLTEVANARTGIGDVLLAGGVASSLLLREMLTERVRRRRIPVRLSFAQPGLSGDNAVGVAQIGWMEYQKMR